MLFIETMGIST